VTIRRDIRGLQEARSAVLRAIAALEPAGALGTAVRDATAATDRYAASITRVDTGAWRASHRPEVDGLSGRISLDPSATNPRSGTRPAVYGAIWEDRGGDHAVYARTVTEAGEGILQETGLRLYRSLP
jgi:hypothetical protein